MLNSSQCELILTGSDFSLPLLYKTKYVFDNCMLQITVDNDQNGILCDDTILYHQYTSGSTGFPKGIEISREAMINFIRGIVRAIPFHNSEIIAGISAVSFDVFLLETLVAIHLGLTVCLCEDEIFHNPRKLIRWIITSDITLIQMTPSRLRQFLYLDNELSFLENVKKILLGGEVLTLSLLKTLQKYTDSNIYNLYGPTETTIWSSVADLTNETQVHIGSPIYNTKFRIMTPDIIEVSHGMQGEICISGEGLAKGYVNNRKLTSEAFVYLDSGERIYKTGDIGMEINENDYVYLGRIDNQVKVRGNRVELEEIEYTANLYPEIYDSVAILEKQNEDDVLILLYTLLSQKNFELKLFIQFMAQKLPFYMIPNKFIKMDKIYLNSNGKKDRKRMKALYEASCMKLV